MDLAALASVQAWLNCLHVACSLAASLEKLARDVHSALEP
jgi:hypothetical protein